MRAAWPLGVLFGTIAKGTATVTILCFLTGCTHLIFHPDHHVYSHPREVGVDYYDVFIKTPDDVQIHGWFLEANGPAKGTVFVLHGNAQNITSHFLTVSWLPRSGYNVFIIDYRGYGDSTGTPTFPEVFVDIKTSLAWLCNKPEVQSRPLYLLGQSLGAALGVYIVGSDPTVKQHLKGVILDASFPSYQAIAREKLSQHLLTWLLQYPLSKLLSRKYDPQKYITGISPLPLLIMHSKHDKVISFEHGHKLFELAKAPKTFIETEGDHIETFRYDQHRSDLLEFMTRVK